MNQPIQILLLILFLAGVFTSCEKDLAVTSQYEEKLVLNGIAKVDLPVSIQLSKTRNILDSNDKIDWVRNADVYLTCDNNNYQEKLTYDSVGVYSSSHIAKYGEKYAIEIVHPTYINVSAEAVMPEKSVALVRYLDAGPGNDNSIFELRIENKQVDNFYIWEMVYTGSDVSSTDRVDIFSTDVKTDNILPDQSHNNKFIFIKGNQVEGEELLSSFIAEIGEVDLPKTTVRLITVNQEMYNYYRTLELYKNAQNNAVEPIEIYTNVINGLGIFGAISVNEITIER